MTEDDDGEHLTPVVKETNGYVSPPIKIVKKMEKNTRYKLVSKMKKVEKNTRHKLVSKIADSPSDRDGSLSGRLAGFRPDLNTASTPTECTDVAGSRPERDTANIGTVRRTRAMPRERSKNLGPTKAFAGCCADAGCGCEESPQIHIRHLHDILQKPS